MGDVAQEFIHRRTWAQVANSWQNLGLGHVDETSGDTEGTGMSYSRRFSNLPFWVFWSQYEYVLPWFYFKKRSFNTVRDVELINVDSLYSAEYEKLLEYELSQATILTESDKSPCQEGFFPNSKSNIKANILFISMNNSKDFGTWLALAKCLHVWDLDARGFHKGLWRLNFNEIPLYVIGAPFSPYSKYKPDALVPLHMSVTKPEAIKSQAILSDKQKIKK